MFDWIELIAKQYSNTIHALAALGSWFAACVAIYLGRKAYSYNVKGDVCIMNIHLPGHKEDGSGYIVLRIDNTGAIPIILSKFSFFWTIPFCKIKIMKIPGCYFKEPYRIEPNRSGSILFSKESEIDNLREKIIKITCGKISFLSSFLKRFLRFTVVTDNGTQFNFKIEKTLKNKLTSDK